jgi:hypothetical protein
MVLIPGNADIWHRGINDLTVLDRTEKIQFNMMASALMWSVWNMYHGQRSEGLMEDINARVWTDLFMSAGFREWVLDHRQYHTDEFGDFLDEVSEAVGDKRHPIGESSSITAGGY